MKVKPNLGISTSDFWYDLTSGGYLKPEEILADPDDVKRVQEAISTVEEFENACDEQIPGFIE